MFGFLPRSPRYSGALLSLTLAVSGLVPIAISTPSFAQNTSPTANPSPSPGTAINFSDVVANYWAQPFIQALAAQNIIAGFPNGTYRPEEPVDRAEFAAMLANAFDVKPVRQLSEPGFEDVPGDYWAVSLIEEAYEAGFLQGYPNNLFLPNQEISRAEAITALVNGLGLTASNQDSTLLQTYYTDYESIPEYATGAIAAATQANLVVNYPNVKELNPQTPLNRGTAAALLYQALVQQGRLQPIANNVAAANYIVRPTANNNVGQTAPTTQPANAPAANNVVAVAASDQSFSTLTSLLKATGLAESLQKQGPFTIFAPTDQAFAALPKGTLEKLAQPENQDTLIRILTYHVVPGELTASQLQAGELKTLADRPVNIQINPAQNQVAVNDVSVVQPNIQASNGVIHAVNQVLLPPNVNLEKLN